MKSKKKRSPAHAAQRPWKRMLNRGWALAAAGALALMGLSAIAVPAHAVSVGPGYSPGGDHRSHLGSFSGPNGTFLLCVEAGKSGPVNRPTADAGIVSQVNGLNAVTMARANFIVTAYGQTSDNNQAAAAAMAMWRLADPAGYLKVAQAAGVSSGDAYVITRAPAAQRAAITAKVAEIRAATDAFVPNLAGAGSGSLVFEVDNNNYVGTVTAAVTPAEARGTITLTNGIFPSTGTDTATNVAAGSVLSVRGVPATGDGAPYKIRGAGDWSAGGGPAADVRLFTTPGAQNIVGPGTTAASAFRVSGEDPHERSQKFAPVVGTTVASKFVAVGEHPVDILTFSTAPFVEDGRNVHNPWALDFEGGHADITAKGVLYGPSIVPFVEADNVPAGTPIAGNALMTTSAADGPTISYQAQSDTPVVEAGHYTWVWSLTYADQSFGTRKVLLDGYSFTDRFGQVAETHVSPASLTISTELAEQKVMVTGSVVDALRPALNGGAWLQAGGARVPVTLAGKAYYSAERPVQSPEVPTGVMVIDELTQVVTGPAAVTSRPINVGSRPGFISVVWSIIAADQPEQFRGFFADWSDDYGVPAETVEVVGPTVRTEAQPVTGPGDTVHDRAIVSGPVPPAGVDVSFAGYLQPPEVMEPVCTPETLVFASAEPVHVAKEGSFQSELFEVTQEHLGTIYWVETTRLTVATSNPAADPALAPILSEGVCGNVSETTLVTGVDVSTIPPTGLTGGDKATDEIVVDGWVTEGVTANVFLYQEDGGQLVCSPDTQVGDALGPIAIEPGHAVDARYTSPETGPLAAGEYGFVAEVSNANGDLLYRGDCHGELFTIASHPKPLVLAKTGSDIGSGLWVAGTAAGALLAGLGLLLAKRIRSRKGQESELVSTCDLRARSKTD